MAISLNRLIKVNPDVIAATGNAIDLNGVILTDNQFIPIGVPLAFSSADTVLKKFGSGSDEYITADVYFRGVEKNTLTPSKLYFARFNHYDSYAAVIGNNLNYNLAQLNGLISLSVNGEPPQWANIDFSIVESFFEAAQIIQNNFTDIFCEYNELTKPL